MKTYIDKDDINALLEHHLDDWCGPECYACSIIKDEIDDMPSADVKEVVHGRWIDRHYKIACSVCNHAVFLGTSDPLIHKEEKRLRNYCSNCGAQMDGDKNE